jgi:hypothetical protein
MTHDDFPGQFYRRYTVGAGGTILVWSFREMRVSGSFHYSEILDHDESKFGFHKWTKNVTTGLFVDRTFVVMDQSFGTWGGFVYSFDKNETYAWGAPPPVIGESKSDVGAGFGVNALFLNHVAPFAHVMYIEYAQFRLGVSLRL